MNRILLGCCGGAAANNFVRSLRAASDPYYIIGMESFKYNIFRSEADEAHLITPAKDPLYIPLLNDLIDKKKPDLLHSQNDYVELRVISEHRENLNVTTFLPSKETFRTCVDKNLSYNAWSKAGLRVPNTMLLNNEQDLKHALDKYGKVWVRKKVGGSGYGSLPTDDFQFAKTWIDHYEGWGDFTAAEYLSPDSITWMSIWKDGELVVAQGRKRLYWEFANRTISGVTGITGTAVTVSDPVLDRAAQDAIYAIDKSPNGIFSVDLTFDKNNHPCPTEINIGRFFTTHLFFTKAGLNMPEIFVKLALKESIPPIEKKINPLKEGLVWIRGVDVLPTLTTTKEVEKRVQDLEGRKHNVSKS